LKKLCKGVYICEYRVEEEGEGGRAKAIVILKETTTKDRNEGNFY
jgi:hypothetical protein